MKKNNQALEKIILEKGLGDAKENARIYRKFFKDWPAKNNYIYQRFGLDFNSKILDIGCTYGHNLIHFAPESVGIEANEHEAGFARALGLKVVNVNAEDDLGAIGEKFDLIWCTDFLVHMISPYKFLYDCRPRLKDKGRLVIQVPLLSPLNMHRSTCHFYAFNKKSLIYLLELAGFKTVKTSGLIRRLPQWLNFALEPLLQLFGGNIWILAEKQEKTPVNFDKVYLPKWFKI
jgi:SAM-dependent methyltransferase